MKPLKIILAGDDSLHRPSTKITAATSKEIIALIKAMKYTLQAAKGLGLAAPQVGHNIRLIVVKPSWREAYALINPEIKRLSPEKLIDNEGCLSFPGEFYPITRALSVKVKALDEHGRKFNLIAKKLEARILQHEIDHLEGILLTDRAKQEKTY